jgi:predicted PurR-regulated permease PerM
VITDDFPGNNTAHIRRAIEVSIRVGLVLLLAATCLLILRPFIPLVAWGIIIAIAAYPAYQKLRSLLGGRGTLAAVICALVFLAILIVPVVLLTKTLISDVQVLSVDIIKDGALSIPPPPAGVEGWFLVGPSVARIWNMASTNLSGLLQSFAPQIKGLVPTLFAASAGIGLNILQFILAILVAGVLLANASGGAEVSRSLACRLFGEQGSEYQDLAGSTIRSVTNGILGVAVVQSFCAGLGFLVVGLPGAGIWTLVFLFSSVLQMGAVLLLPAVIYVFATASTTKAILFLIWCVFVGLMDNVLKPLLLGRGVAVPIAVVFLGAIGGFIAMGIIGLFIGAIILSVGYKLFLAWLEGPVAAKLEG